MIIRDGDGKVIGTIECNFTDKVLEIGSIEFTDKELKLEKDKFEKLRELASNILKTEKISL